MKRYDAIKMEGEDGAAYERIVLRPDSTDPSFKPIEIDLEDDEGAVIVARLVSLLV